MTDSLPTLTVKTPGSEFTLRLHAAAWSDEYGGEVRRKRRRYGSTYPGLLMLSATGPDTSYGSSNSPPRPPQAASAIAGTSRIRFISALLPVTRRSSR